MQRVLIIDDSSATRAYIRAALEAEEDMEVTEATSGFDALRILPRSRFDLLLVDINMPNINGLELISFIRRSETHRETPLMIISTEASERDRSRAMQLGANAYLAKPFTADALLTAVRDLQAASARKKE
jgi:two-component system, chemotaxis family, chemotaxis protein CheY